MGLRGGWPWVIASAIGAAACQFDTSGVGLPAEPRFECPVDIVEYGVGNPPATMPVTKAGDDPSAWQWRRFELVTPSPPLTLYVDDGHVPYEIPPNVAGSYLLQVPRGDRTLTQSTGYLSIPVAGTEFQRLWLAFDTRAPNPPLWLRSRFDPRVARIRSTACSGAIGLPPGACETEYQLWAPKVPEDFLGSIDLGANNAAGTTWSDGQVGEQYLLLVRMQPSVTPVELRTLGTLEVSFEIRSDMAISAGRILGEASDELAAWLAQSGNAGYASAVQDGRVRLRADPALCEQVCWVVGSETQCARGALGVTEQPIAVNSWPRSSEGQVDPSRSSGVVTIVESGSSAATQLAGQVKFRITELGDAELGAIDLVGSDVALEEVDITGISVAHDADALARCADALPPSPYRLCTDYAIRRGGFVASGVSELNGDTLPLRLVNDAGMPLAIDFNARTFHLQGGPLSSRFLIDGEQRTVNLTIDVTGDFVNFAPLASAQETQPFWECQDNSQATVTLIGSASFDQDGHGDLASFLWVEDLGELSQTVLGTTSTVVRSMPFGTHALSLVVTDTEGISSTASFELAVVDSRIDSLSFPPDLVVEDHDEPGEIVDPGTAAGSDDCSGVVDLRSDAPADHRFGLGFTPITWVADDLRGNVETHTQKIYVLRPIHVPPPRLTVRGDLTLVGVDDLFTVTLEVEGQGRAMELDEYVWLTTADGAYRSLVDDRWVDGVVPRVEAGSFGEGDTEEIVYSGMLAREFPGHGHYRLSAALVVPGASPLERADIVGTGWADVWVETLVFRDGFENGNASAWTTAVGSAGTRGDRTRRREP